MVAWFTSKPQTASHASCHSGCSIASYAAPWTRVHHKCPSLHSKSSVTFSRFLLRNAPRMHYRMTIASMETSMSRHRQRKMGQLALSLNWPQPHRVPPQIHQAAVQALADLLIEALGAGKPDDPLQGDEDEFEADF